MTPTQVRSGAIKSIAIILLFAIVGVLHSCSSSKSNPESDQEANQINVEDEESSVSETDLVPPTAPEETMVAPAAAETEFAAADTDTDAQVVASTEVKKAPRKKARKKRAAPPEPPAVEEVETLVRTPVSQAAPVQAEPTNPEPQEPQADTALAVEPPPAPESTPTPVVTPAPEPEPQQEQKSFFRRLVTSPAMMGILILGAIAGGTWGFIRFRTKA